MSNMRRLSEGFRFVFLDGRIIDDVTAIKSMLGPSFGEGLPLGGNSCTRTSLAKELGLGSVVT